MSTANMYYEIGSLKIVIDGYRSAGYHKANFMVAEVIGSALTYPYKPDVAAVTRDAGAVASSVNLRLWVTATDHSFDTATWSKLTGLAPLTHDDVLSSDMEKIPSDRCTAVYGGEKVTLGRGCGSARSAVESQRDSTTNPGATTPVELGVASFQIRPPEDFATELALRFSQLWWNARFPFTVEGPQCGVVPAGTATRTRQCFDLAVPIVIEGKNYGARLKLRLQTVMMRLDSVDFDRTEALQLHSWLGW